MTRGSFRDPSESWRSLPREPRSGPGFVSGKQRLTSPIAAKEGKRTSLDFNSFSSFLPAINSVLSSSTFSCASSNSSSRSLTLRFRPFSVSESFLRSSSIVLFSTSTRSCESIEVVDWAAERSYTRILSTSSSESVSSSRLGIGREPMEDRNDISSKELSAETGCERVRSSS